MNAKQEIYKDMEHLPENQVFPPNTSSLLTLIGIIVMTFGLCMLAFFTY